MGNKRVKAYIAFLLLIALVTQNSYSSIADIGNVKSVYASEVDENGTAEDEIVSDDTIIPSEDVLTPGDDTQTPGDDTQAPSENVGTPSENTGTPSENTGTPSGNTCTPSENAGTPSENTISPSMDKIVEDELEIIDGMIVGKGYDTITISVNSLKLGEKKFYNLYIDTKAAGITANSNIIVGNKIGKYDRSVESVVIKGLNSESFKIYAKGITTDVSASFDVTSVEAGTVNMTVKSDAEAVRRVYEYHDEDVKVTATLEEASAIPDDAELNVTAIKEGKEYDDYVKMIEEKSKEDPSLLLSNYLLYDISFILDGQEIEPEQGTVSVIMEFLKKQLKEENSTSVNEVVVLHVNDENECEVLEDTEADTTKNVVNQVEFVTDSFSTFILGINDGFNYPSSDDKFDEDNYNLNYILNHFNLFISGNVKTNHTVGEVAVGGNGKFPNVIGIQEYKHKVSSYIKGVFYSYPYDAIRTNTDVPLYLGTSNNGKKFNCNSIIKITDNYINFDYAFNMIKMEVEYLSKNLKFENNSTKYEIGKNYRVKLNGKNLNINIKQKKFDKDTIFLDESNGTISFTHQPNGIDSSNIGSEMGVVFLFPNAEEIVIPNSSFFGHIIAPNAVIKMDSGNYNGCIIAKELNSVTEGAEGPEGHMWPYSGKIIKPTVSLKAYKNVEGKPATDQKFQFELYEKSYWGWDWFWDKKQTVDNKGADVIFPLSYDSNEKGEHIYKIVELYNDSLGYKENKTSYYAKVTVLNNGNVNTIQYYSNEYCTKVVEPSGVVFNNLKEIPKGRLQVQKVGGSLCNKFYFTIKDSNNNYIPNSNGKNGWVIHGGGETVIVKDLPFGTYTINEVENEEGDSLGPKFPYIVSYSIEDGKVTIDSDQTKKLIITNTPNPSADLIINKYDSSDKHPLDGANFTLEYEYFYGWDNYPYGSTEYENIEAENGVLKIPSLKYEGNYRIIETVAPEGYKKLNNPFIKFNLEFKHGDNVFSDIKYDKLSESVSFNTQGYLGNCGETYTGGIVTVYNEKAHGSIELTKTDESGTKVLPGAQFKLYKDGNLYEITNTKEGTVISGNIVIGSQSTYQVDANGKLKISNLPVGIYYFEEVKAPYGYELPAVTKTNDFIISQDNQNNDFVINIKNTPILGSFKIIKIGEEGKKLSGAKFKLVDPDTQKGIPLNGKEGRYKYNETNGSTNLILETKSDSTLMVSGLPFGTYQLIEVEAPYGYNIDKATATNIVIDSKKMVSQNIVNSKITANVEFYKADEGSKEKKTISGATFELYKVLDDKKVELKDTLTSGEDGRVYKENLEAGNYYFEEVKAPLGYQLDNTKIEFTISKDNDGTKILLGDSNHKIYNERATGRVKIEKTDASNNLIDGAKFNLYSDHPRNNIKSIIQDRLFGKEWFLYEKNITTVSGSVIINNLPWGDYYLVETEAPTGKVKSTQHYPFTISANHLEDTTYTGTKAIRNESIKGSVKLVKKDSVTGNPMSNVEFNLFKINDNLSEVPVNGTFITKDGELQVKDLEYGNYYFIEKNVVKGYQANTTKYKFSILEPTPEIVEVFAENVPVSGNVTISKNDSKDHPLAGAEFTLYSKEPTTIQMLLAYFNNDNNIQGYTVVNSHDTGDDGIVTFENLTWGDYAIKETRAPKGYDLDPTIKCFTVNAEQQSFTYKYVDQELTGSIKLEKVDAETQDTLSGANFQLYKDGKPYDKVEIMTTDKNGSISVDHLPWGTYYFVETKAPDGYILDTKPTEKITISRDNVPGTFTFKTFSNQPTNISFSKKSTSGESEIEGAILAVTEKESGTEIERWESDEKPHSIKAKLCPNKTYVMSEIEAPKGYAYAEPYEFKVSADGTVNNSNTVIMKDKPLELKIRKTDISGNALEGAKFILTNSSNEIIEIWKSASGNEAYHVVDAKQLTAGETYQLSENIAPEGYQIAKEIIITISRNGTVTSTTKDAIGGNIVTMRDEAIRGNVTLKKTYDKGKKTLEGVSFELYKGITPNGKLQNQYITDASGTISVNGLLYGDYYFKEITPKGYKEYIGNLSFKISEQGKTITLDIDNERKLGSVILKKIDGFSEKVLPGAEFQMYKDGEPYEKVMTTDENGLISVHDLPWGTYYFVETKAPNGYILNTNPTEEIEIGSDTVSGTLAFETVSNQPTQINFSKQSEWGELEVAGAELVINEKESGDKVDSWTSTDKPHLITAKLNPNTIYVMSEIKAPNGYGYGEPIEFTVSANGTVGKNSHSVTMKDRPFNLRVRKTDLSGNELAGAVFALMNSADEEIDSWTSDNKEDHVVDVAKLTPGETYQLIEKSAPVGYQTAEKITITISRNGTITTNPKDAFNDGIVMVRDEVISGNVILKKTDATDNKPLKGVSFELYKGIAPSGTLIKKDETDDKGIISVNGLLYGDYYFKEITPQGYQEYKGVLSFKISEQGKEITLDVKNERMLGSVTLTKIDGVSKNGVYQTLSGAEFKLYTKEPQSTPQSMLSFFLKNVYYEYQDNENIVYTTGEDGKLTVTGLPWGSYYFVETKAPKGYETPMSTTYPFIIDATKEQQMTIDIGEIKNFKETTKPPVKKSSSSDEETTTTTSTGNSVTGVLGIASAPIYGVLGARMSPLTGDNLNAFFWLMLLSLSGGTVGTVIFVKKRKKRKVE